jgi:hypothetical protein
MVLSLQLFRVELLNPIQRRNFPREFLGRRADVGRRNELQQESNQIFQKYARKIRTWILYFSHAADMTTVVTAADPVIQTN